MGYSGLIYRPPIEAGSFLLPITEGCTHNSCAFCNMYQGIPFRMLPLDEVEGYLAAGVERRKWNADLIRRVYLVGGDPFALTADLLLERIDLIRRYLPQVKVITMYARVDNVATKTDEDLVRLAEAGVNDLYVGVESGLDDVLASLNKGYSTVETKQQCRRLARAGIRHCDLLMLGCAGEGRGIEEATAAAALENETRPSKVLFTTMTSFVGTQLEEDIRAGRFRLASEKEALEEEMRFLELLDLPECFFWAVHPLDAVSVQGYLQDDKEDMLRSLARAIAHADETVIQRSARIGTL